MITPQITLANCIKAHQISPDIYEVILKPDTFIPYEPGQYLKIKIAKTWVPYSIANAPNNTGTYVLHIKHTAFSETTKSLFHDFNTQAPIEIQLPFGVCYLKKLPQDRPIIFIAGGTGLAPIHAMIQGLLSQKSPPHFELYWCVKEACDLYWSAPTTHFYPCITTTQDNTFFNTILNRHLNDLKTFSIVLSGPFDMVYMLRDKLIEAGVNITQLYADAFEYEEQ
jgi:CDP-4-dehydro-6-deoxyglucose reductase